MPFHQLEGSTIEILSAVLRHLKEIILLAKAVRGLCAVIIQCYTLFSINLGTLKTAQGFFINMDGIHSKCYIQLLTNVS